jgi:hypothetical protein
MHTSACVQYREEGVRPAALALGCLLSLYCPPRRVGATAIASALLVTWRRQGTRSREGLTGMSRAVEAALPTRETRHEVCAVALTSPLRAGLYGLSAEIGSSR